MNTAGTAGFFLKSILPTLVWMSGSLAGTPEMPSSMIHMKSVKDKVLNGYDKTVRPTVEGLNTTLVAVELIPRQILEVDEEKGVFVLDSYLSLTWIDPRLRWDISEYDGILQLPSDLLWVPNIVIHNSHCTRINPNGEALLSVLAEGFISWISPIHTETACKTLNHPNDVITCIVRIGSRVHDGWEIDVFRDKHLLLKGFSNINPRWELLVSQTKVITNKTEHTGRMILNTIFPMKRRIPAEIDVTRQLCILVMVLALSIFWLPPNSSKKVLLGGMLILILIQLLLYVAWSTKYPLTALFRESSIQSIMYIVVATLLLQVLVVFNVCKITGPARPPTFVIRLLKGALGKFLCLRLPVDNNKKLSTDEIYLQESTPKNMPSPSTRDDWMLFASSLDRLFFVIMTIAGIAVYA